MGSTLFGVIIGGDAWLWVNWGPKEGLLYCRDLWDEHTTSPHYCTWFYDCTTDIFWSTGYPRNVNDYRCILEDFCGRDELRHWTLGRQISNRFFCFVTIKRFAPYMTVEQGCPRYAQGKKIMDTYIPLQFWSFSKFSLLLYLWLFDKRNRCLEPSVVFLFKRQDLHIVILSLLDAEILVALMLSGVSVIICRRVKPIS